MAFGTSMSGLASTRVAKLCVVEAGAIRSMHDWEIDAILRNRLNGSSEPAPSDTSLCLQQGEGIQEAYERDFGNWYWTHFVKEE